MIDPKTIEFKKGETYRIWHSGSGRHYKIHIVEVINEGLSWEPQIVFRYFGQHKQWWHYEIKGASFLTIDVEKEKQYKG